MSKTEELLPGLQAHPAGALWIEASRTALIADVHLGYSWAQRRRGELGPLADARSREKLFALADELNPAQIVFLGDLVHAPRPGPEERGWIEETLNHLSARSSLISVRGNHDRAFAKEFKHLNIQFVESWSSGAIAAFHGDKLPCDLPEDRTLVVGHLHPSIPVIDAAGAGRKLPIFLATPACIVLPAFSPFSRGFDVACGLPGDLIPCFGSHEIQAYAASPKRVVHLGPLAWALQRMYSAYAGAPENFRKGSGSS